MACYVCVSLVNLAIALPSVARRAPAQQPPGLRTEGHAKFRAPATLDLHATQLDVLVAADEIG